MRHQEQRLRATGLRDYSSWAFDLFPGKGGFTDIDAIYHKGSANRFLVLEFKQEGEPLPEAQSILLRALSRIPGFTVAVVVERTDGGYLVGKFGPAGIGECKDWTRAELRSACSLWEARGVFG